MRVIALLTDAFGGHGGIALYNRDLLIALCAYPGCSEVVAIPRLMPNPTEPQPPNLTYVCEGINSKYGFVRTVLKTVQRDPRFDLIICAHINLIPVAMLLKAWLKVPVILEVYGIEVWEPTPSFLSNSLVRNVDVFLSISDISRQRFLSWSKVAQEKGYLLPNAIHLDRYAAGSPNALLLKRYGIEGKTVIMTVGRLVSHERYKGFDEVLDLLPELARDYPDLVYLIVGMGDDKARLECQAEKLGIRDRVVFTGFVAESEKADHYRLANAYVMPSQGEGFGFVFLEALACGIPCVGSTKDGSREALRYGQLGQLVDPNDRSALKEAVTAAIEAPRGVIPPGLEHFSFENFTLRLWDIIKKAVNEP